ncbi:eukaryotic translation initiation factor 3 subunit 8 N-terminus-domain-containing protein [Cantharellus anzutake]|uniref:eukaryotic translation initiation factor 3 subunit 8 N-terminus-domain-containing protein n=1 Tax=Cantharellus anzutake TaxID=1750568 RepID=UPI00190807BB|nr:eukaryotic translation initiation factor 3 subunit 8 N-terminus-domain-containing protein [Cantharellus anzutake]KAF8324477.1 eukaryotic translation initiation factor 3 subunit 8 N-terminus-domain-containing protein [Cantharellus anzutake]
MSRFFRRGSDSSDESSSSEEEELLSQDESDNQKPAKDIPPRGCSDESSDESESDDDDDKSEPEADKHEKRGREKNCEKCRDKRLEEWASIASVIEQKLKGHDWHNTNNEFDKLTRLVVRQMALGEPLPPVYLQVIKSIDGAFNSDKEKPAKLDAANARSLNTIRQKIRKLVKEYETQLQKYNEDPEAFASAYLAATKPKLERIAPRPVATPDVDADDGFTTVGKGGKAYSTLATLNEARGKKSTDRGETTRVLEQLLKVARTPYGRIRVLLALISTRFDINTSTSHMSNDAWIQVQSELNELLNILITERQYVVVEDDTLEYDEMAERVPRADEPVVRIRGSIIMFIDRLDEEFTRSLQNLDPHGTEYVDRLKDEKPLYETICWAHILFEKVDTNSLARIVMRRLEHIYSKPTAVVTILENSVKTSLASSITPTFPSLALLSDTAALIRALCVHLYQTEYSLLRTRAMLCHVYFHALHNRFHTGRDLLLMSHLPETIHNADVMTQIMFNRAVVQLGLCAFRSGLIKEAHSTLQDIFTTQRVKELLAQGVHQQRYTALTPEQEKAERARQMPFHMHINTELLEAAFLVSSMLVEIPLLASIDNEEQKRKAISKPFRRLLDFADRQVFTGPPESTRDHIMQASRALQDGEWEKCKDLIQSIKIWSLMPEEATVKEMLAKRIQEEGLRTYLFTYSAYYTTASLSSLAKSFCLPVRSATSVVSKMIWNEEIAASLDQSAGTVVFHRVELSRVQQLAQNLADRVSQLSEQNTKALDQKLSAATASGVPWPDGRGPTENTEQQQVRRERDRLRGRGPLRGARGIRFDQGLGGRIGGAIQS